MTMDFFCKYNYSMHCLESSYFISIFNQYIFIISDKSMFYDGRILNICVFILCNVLVCLCLYVYKLFKTKKQLDLSMLNLIEVHLF